MAAVLRIAPYSAVTYTCFDRYESYIVKHFVRIEYRYMVELGAQYFTHVCARVLLPPEGYAGYTVSRRRVIPCDMIAHNPHHATAP